MQNLNIPNLTTPPKVRLSIRMFLKKIGLKSRPRFLEFTKISDNYLQKYCLSNCEAEQKTTGAQIVHGWMIWEDKKNKHISAEFHAVIKNKNKLLDITPRADNEEKILFVPDNTKKAKRIDEKTWQTWSNFEAKNGKLILSSSEITLRDISSNILNT